jgi:uncharacterized cupredoxin-like copper-binding protein
MGGGRITLAVGAGAAAALLAACGSGGGGSSGYGGGGGSTAGASPRAAAPASGTPVSVDESEFTIALGTKTLHPGAYTFQVHNKGTIAHNLTIEGPGVSDQASPTMQPGSSGQVSVTLQAGTYQFFCSVDAHRDRGMQVTVQVK